MGTKQTSSDLLLHVRFRPGLAFVLGSLPQFCTAQSGYLLNDRRRDSQNRFVWIPCIRKSNPMLRSSEHDATSDLFHGARPKRFRGIVTDTKRSDVRNRGMVNATSSVEDLESLARNRLEALRIDLHGFFSIRINDHWRVIFRWTDGAAEDVEIFDSNR